MLIFDLSEQPDDPQQIGAISGFTANDVILDNGLMMVVCEDGLRQYDYSNSNDVQFLSF